MSEPVGVSHVEFGACRNKRHDECEQVLPHAHCICPCHYRGLRPIEVEVEEVEECRAW